MKRLLKWACLTIMLVFLFGSLLVAGLMIQPLRQAQTLWLTRMYRSELEPVAQRYLNLHATIEGWQDPNVMAQVIARGKYLDDLIQLRCVECASIEVATGIQIQAFRVLDYKTNTSKVRVRYEGAWQLVDPQTRAVIGQCNVGVYDIELILSREDNIWKVADVGEYIPKVISTDEFDRLQTKYCSR